MGSVKRNWVLIAVVLGGLFLLCILLVPAGLLLARLGLTPVCIQGEWPRFRIVSCPGARPSAERTPLPTLDAQAPIPIIVDDDGSPDGLLALLYFLGNPLFDVRAVTVSNGEAHPEVFAPHIQQLLAALDRPDIPVGAGRDAPLEGDNAFPDPWREGSDAFWGLDLPHSPAAAEPVPAAALIVDVLTASPEPVLVFVSGPHTNLAEALRLEPGIAANIRAVHVMGGSIDVPGNIYSDWSAIDNRVAEWNIWVDPVAAAEVFGSGLPLHLTPLDATNRVLWTRTDARDWAAARTAEGALAGELLQGLLRSWDSGSVPLWDLVAAVNAADASACPGVPRSLEVVTTPGPEQGRTVATGSPPNAVVCLEPDPDRIKARAAEVFGK